MGKECSNTGKRTYALLFAILSLTENIILFTFILFMLFSFNSCSDSPVFLLLDDFEDKPWQGLIKSDQRIKQGRFSGKWVNFQKQQSIRLFEIPKDWYQYDRLTFWLYSENAKHLPLSIVCNSENKDDLSGWDYFSYKLTVDWQGWKLISLDLRYDFKQTRHPRGWDQIDAFLINANYNDILHQDAAVFLDDMRLVKDKIRLKLNGPVTSREEDGSIRIQYDLIITNQTSKVQTVAITNNRIDNENRSKYYYHLNNLQKTIGPIRAGDTVCLPLFLTASLTDTKNCEPLKEENFEIRLTSEYKTTDFPVKAVHLKAIVPLPKREHPFLFADKKTIAQAKKRVEKHLWAKWQLARIIGKADIFLKEKLDIPAEGGQWFHHYVCKKDGWSLQYKDGRHICEKCGSEYFGWPYDQVIIARIHVKNWQAIKTLGLAYAFTQNETYALKARELLLQYAEKYLTIPIHDLHGELNPSPGAARVFASTLAEAVHIIGVAWGYDLIYKSSSLSDRDRDKIENKFLRKVVETLRSYNASKYNAWAWHNAAFAAIGFCLQDEDIAWLSLNEWSGLKFQLAHSVLCDGFWWEGAVGYHYYALDAMRWTTEAAYFAGIDFYQDSKYKSLFDAPLRYIFPDLNFPAVNDSYLFSITENHPLYEIAYARFKNPDYLTVIDSGKRGSIEALLWGIEELEPPPEFNHNSKDFAGIGAVTLRQGKGEDEIYTHLDYGSHGGGHGHPDKLAMILFALGRQLSPDPGTTMYSSPLHGSWYSQTFAHNTVVVDRKSQNPAEGKLTLFYSEPGFAVSRAQCATAYPGVTMDRTLALTPEYLIDVFSVNSEQEHIYDWLYHNFGEVIPGIPTKSLNKPISKSDGYQHITDIKMVQTDSNWFSDFRAKNANVRITMIGEPNTSIYFGNGIANSLGPYIAARNPISCPMMVVRREGTRSMFVSVIEPYRSHPKVKELKRVEVNSDDAIVLEITRENGKVDLIMIANQVGVIREFRGIRTLSRIYFAHLKEGIIQQAFNVE